MKRCIVCGNIGSDDDTVCSVCGSLLVEMEDVPEEGISEASPEKAEGQTREMRMKEQGDETPAAQKEAAEPELTVISEEPAARESVDVDKLMKAAAEKTSEAGVRVEETVEAQETEPADTLQEAGSAEAPQENRSAEAPQQAKPVKMQTAQRTVPRRKKGGPQIYGQESMEEYSGAQGVIRRDVQGGHVSAEDRTGAGEASGRSASRPPRRPAPAPESMAVQNTSAEVSARAASCAPANAQNMPGNGTRPSAQTQKAGAPYIQQPSQGGQGYGQHGGKHSGMARRIMETARGALSSPLLIVVALLQTVYFASSVAAIFLRQLNYEQGAKLLALLPLPSQISGYTSLLQAAMAQLDSGALILNLVIRIPDLLFCIALWALCITARSAKENMSGAGFLFMRITVILNMIAACAALLVVLVVFVTFVIAAWNAGTTSLITLAVAALVLAIIVTMAVLMYFFCYLSTIKTIRKNAVNGEQYGSVSAYVAVVKMVTALTAIISILSGIVNLEITGITSGAGQLGWMILFGVWILKYRSTLGEYAE